MKKSVLFSGLLMSIAGAFSLSAAPVPQKSVNELLGLRPQTGFQSAPVIGYSNLQNVATPPHLLSDDNNVVINASVVFPDNVQGMWGYSTAEYNPTRLSVNPEILATGGGFEAGGYYYTNRYREMMGFEEIKTINYNTSTWEEYDIYTGQIDYVATTMAYTPLRDEVYGCFINADRNGYNFVRWNYDRFVPGKVIAPIERPWSGCAFSSDGTLYAIERNGDLYKVNLANGEMTKVGSTGIESTYLTDATIDIDTDIMYWAVATDSEWALYKVDIATAAATKLYDLANEEQLCGMYVVKNVEYPAAAPAAISSTPSASFSGTSLSGTISFYTSRYATDNSVLDSETELTWTLYVNGVEYANGQELPYKRVNVPVTMEEPGYYYFSVTISNEAGTSPAKGYHKFVGPDEPKAPTSFPVTLVSVDGENKIQLQWGTPSSTGVNGGNVNYSAATYKIVRYPDNKVLFEGATATSTDRKIQDEIPNPEVRTEYYYILSTEVEGLKAPDVKSISYFAGPVTPAAELVFDNALSFIGWTVIDANEDTALWKYYAYNKCAQLSGSKGFDDWLISPAVKVKGGTSYPVSIAIKTSSYYEESIEVKWGTAPTVEAMTNTAIAVSSAKSSSEEVVFTGEISVEEAGTIYIGIHGCTETTSNTINLYNLTIESGLTAAAPAAVTDFSVVTPTSGAREATVSFVAPSVDLSGAPLEGENATTKIEISRDGDVIATITEGIGAGEAVEYVDRDENLTLGNHVYGVVASNIHGEGAPVEKEVLVGARKPVAPESATFVEDENSGKVTISWTPVTTDFEGNTIGADAVTYRVINRAMETIANNVSGTSFTYQAVEEGEQAFVQFGVYAVTAGGESDKMAATAYKPAGEPYATPWVESFSNGSPSHIFGYNYIQGQEPWSFNNAGNEWGISAQDNDGGFAYLECYGTSTALVTGKINLEGLYNPALTYYTYNYQGSRAYNNAFEVQVDNGNGEGFVTVQKDVVDKTGPYDQWNKVTVDLNEFEGQSVIIRFLPTDIGLAFFTLDNLRIGSNVDRNLAITNIDAPTVVDLNKPFEVSVTVANNGQETINSYTVEIFKDNELIDTKEGARIAPEAVVTTVFEVSTSVLDNDYANIHAHIVCPDDEVEADNTSEVATVGVVRPHVPVIADLAVSSEAGVHTLTWSEPDGTGLAPEPYTETFEDAESWSSTVNDWKFVDEDKAPFGGIQTPNYPATGAQSWFVADHAWSGWPEEGAARWTAHSGEKYIASEYVLRGGENVQSDDWAITPRLFTGAQAISLFAKSFDPSYLETFEVLASSGTTSLDDFKSVGTVVNVPNAWTQYRFMLPEGTKYAAIRSRSINKFVLFIDDVTFIPSEGEAARLEVKGYHVYRNNVRLTASPVAENSFIDESAAPTRDHNYFVTAVYDKGESRPSNTVTVQMSGVDSLTDGSNVVIRQVEGGIEVRNLTAGVVTVNTIDGRTVARVAASPVVRINLPSALYIVSAGNKVAKVIVK